MLTDVRIKDQNSALRADVKSDGTNNGLVVVQHSVNDYPTLGTPVVLAISGTSARTAALTAGKYLLYTEVTCGWRQGTGDPTAVLATDAPLPAGALIPVTLAAQKLAAITAGASGNLYIVPVS